MYVDSNSLSHVKTLGSALRSVLYGSAFLTLWGWLALQTRRADPVLAIHLPAATHAAGIVLMVLGAALCIWCVASFVVVGRGTPAPFDAPRAFVATGPYRRVRNPMYLGLFLLLAGFGAWNKSPAMMLFTLPVAALAHAFVVLYEERTLERRFGARYLEYKRAVRRWLPTFGKGSFNQQL